MKTTRILLSARSLLLVGASALLLAGCGRDEPEAVTEITPEARSLMAHVPADTPYLGGNLAALPDEIIDLQFQRYAPVTAEAQRMLDDMRADLAAEEPAEAADRLVLAVLAELDGNLSRAGLERLGLDLQNIQAIYGMGAFPVARISLSDAATLRATIERVLANAGVTAEELRFRDVAYWRAPLDTEEVPLALYTAVLPTHLAVGLLPVGAEADLLPAFLGLELPADSDAVERLAALNAAHGFTPYMTFTVDLHRLADEFMDTDSATVRALGAEIGAAMSGMDATCAAEIHDILDRFPRVTVGVSELETHATAFRGIVEMPTGLADRLRALTAQIPVIGEAAGHVADFAFGIRVGAARDFLRSEAQAVVDAPFECEQLDELNVRARELITQLDQPLPPFVNNFRGLNFRLKTLELDPEGMIPSDIRGHAAVQVENPQMFVGMAKMFLPDLSELELAPGDEPVRVPEYLGSFQNIVAYAAVSKDAIGISLGEGEQDGLAAYLNRPTAPTGTLLAADYDSAAWYRWQQRDVDTALATGGDANPFLGLAKVAGDTLEAVNDRHRVEVKFTAQGLVFDSRYTYR